MARFTTKTAAVRTAARAIKRGARAADLRAVAAECAAEIDSPEFTVDPVTFTCEDAADAAAYRVARLRADLSFSPSIKPAKQARWMFPRASEDAVCNIVGLSAHVEIVSSTEEMAEAYSACTSCMQSQATATARAYHGAGVAVATLRMQWNGLFQITARCLVWIDDAGRVCRAPKAYGVKAQALLDVLDAAGLLMSDNPVACDEQVRQKDTDGRFAVLTIRPNAEFTDNSPKAIERRKLWGCGWNEPINSDFKFEIDDSSIESSWTRYQLQYYAQSIALRWKNTNRNMQRAARSGKNFVIKYKLDTLVFTPERNEDPRFYANKVFYPYRDLVEHTNSDRPRF